MTQGGDERDALGGLDRRGLKETRAQRDEWKRERLRRAESVK